MLSLAQGNERLQIMCDELTSEVCRLRAQNFDEVDNTDREQDDIE